MGLSPEKIKEVWDKLPLVVKNSLYALDRYVNWKLGGDRSETVSERLAKARNKGMIAGKIGCSILDHYDPGHCDRAIKTKE